MRRIVARLEAMPADQARFVASAAYTLARAANADMDISDEEITAIEGELQAHEGLDEPTAVLVAEMAKLQARTVGSTEDYVVTREFRNLASELQRISVLRACFAIAAVERDDLRGGELGAQRDRARARPRPGDRQRGPRRLPREALVGPGSPAGRRHD